MDGYLAGNSWPRDRACTSIYIVTELELKCFSSYQYRDVCEGEKRTVARRWTSLTAVTIQVVASNDVDRSIMGGADWA